MPELLRLATAGSVDDGKSTLIGRLLYDAKAVLADQLAHVEEVSRRRGEDGARPRAAHGRPARRARAGHHHRRRLPPVRHRAPPLHHRRHARPRAVHAQHGHGRLDGRPRADPGRRAARHDGAVAPPHGDREAARPAPRRGVRQQDGPRRLRRGRVRRGRPRGARPGGADRPARHHLHPDLRPARRQRGRARRRACRGTRARRCSPTWRACRSAAPRARPACRCRPCCAASGGCTPARSPPASLRVGDEVVVLPGRRAHARGRASRARPGRSTRRPRRCPWPWRWRTSSTSAAATCWPPPTPRPSPRASWRRRSAGSATPRRGPAAATCSSTRAARSAPASTRIAHRLDVTSLERAPADRARAQRPRAGPPAPRRARGRRSVRRLPRHRRVHPHRRGDERHGGRGHGRGVAGSRRRARPFRRPARRPARGRRRRRPSIPASRRLRRSGVSSKAFLPVPRITGKTIRLIWSTRSLADQLLDEPVAARHLQRRRRTPP